MYYLHMAGRDFGMKAEFVKAAYETLENAQRQAAANLHMKKQEPKFISDEQGKIAIDYREMGKAEIEEIVNAYREELANLRAERYRNQLLAEG